jgi:hypothetical protein
VTDSSNAPALVLELLTWVGIVPGVVLLAAGYLRRAFSSRYQETWGVIIASPAGTGHPWFRWMDLGRELQSAPVPAESGHGDGTRPLRPGDEVLVYFDARRPDRGRLDDPRADGHLLRLLGWVLAGVGVLAAVAQIVILVVQGGAE